MKKLIILMSILVSAWIMALSQNVFAAQSLSVLPFEGGSSLRFGAIDVSGSRNKEVRIRISSTDDSQYQIYQRIAEPFRNDRGVELDPDAITAYSLTGSNTAGTLYQQDMMSLRHTDALLYTSSQSGTSDSFIMIYQPVVENFNTSGRFFGQILYTLRPIRGGAQQEIVLNVFIDSYGEFKVDMETSQGGSRILINPALERSRSGYSSFSFEGNIGGSVKIYQDINELPIDEFNNPLCSDCVLFRTTNEGDGQPLFANETPMKYGRKLIYSSEASHDRVIIEYTLAGRDADGLKAGTYRSKVDYALQTDEGERVETVDLEIHIDPVFELLVEYPEGGMHFSNLLPNTPPQTREVDVTVNTNLGRPYIVSQRVVTPLTNEAGDIISGRYFRMKQDFLSESFGRLGFSNFSEVPQGEEPVFFSDNNGSSVRFKVTYELRPYPEITAGNYSTSIVYSLGEK